MQYPERAVPIWFGRGKNKDAAYLQAWRQSPVTFSQDPELDHHWNADRYEILLGNDITGKLFQRAARLALTNQFYPPQVMVAESDFALQKRQVKIGDRVLQRIQIFQILGKPALEVLTMNEITEVIEEPRRVGFTYATTLTHSEIGEWSPTIEWRENNDVVLVINVLSRTRPGASAFSQRFTRKMQLRAHQLSNANFLDLLNVSPQPVHKSQFSAEILPAGLLAAAVLLLLVTLLGVNRNSH